MDDLIRREDAMQRFSDEVNQSRKDHIHINTIKRLLDDVDVAYNVDKVVEQIEEVLQDLNVLEIMCHLDSDSTIQNDLDNFLQAIKNEISRRLKAGGVNG